MSTLTCNVNIIIILCHTRLLQGMISRRQGDWAGLVHCVTRIIGEKCYPRVNLLKTDQPSIGKRLEKFLYLILQCTLEQVMHTVWWKSFCDMKVSWLIKNRVTCQAVCCGDMISTGTLQHTAVFLVCLSCMWLKFSGKKLQWIKSKGCRYALV